MKKDVPTAPKRVPRKRRQLERVPAVWLAEWLDRDLTEDERERVGAEKQRRKQAKPDNSVVGLLVGPEGVTPDQMAGVLDALGKARPTEIHHPGVSGKLHSGCRELGVPVVVHRGDMREVVRVSQALIGAPKEREKPSTKTAVWDMVSYARHRGLEVVVVMPNGQLGGT